MRVLPRRLSRGASGVRASRWDTARAERGTFAVRSRSTRGRSAILARAGLEHAALWAARLRLGLGECSASLALRALVRDCADPALCARDGRGALTRIDGEMRGVVLDPACHRRPRARVSALAERETGEGARSTLAALFERHAALFFSMNVPVSVGFRRRTLCNRGPETLVRSTGFAPPRRVQRASEECSVAATTSKAARSFGNGPPCEHVAAHALLSQSVRAVPAPDYLPRAW